MRFQTIQQLFAPELTSVPFKLTADVGDTIDLTLRVELESSGRARDWRRDGDAPFAADRIANGLIRHVMQHSTGMRCSFGELCQKRCAKQRAGQSRSSLA